MRVVLLRVPIESGVPVALALLVPPVGAGVGFGPMSLSEVCVDMVLEGIVDVVYWVVG